ncbi:MAG: hypothetical protein AB8B60_02840 [Sulfitobacter sp.]
MTALARTQIVTAAPKASDATSIDTGAGVEMFVSGSAPTGSDMMAGDGTALYVTSVLEAGSEASDGDGTGLFVTSV